ncbi:hypothetical protein CYY_003845 [Polysphondylium violaceum]|uniref:LIM zinc-binding domain-containing protein n=1 Tax=Polysphondylium violaceum TaxID=133409 RepID=A0A8J4PW74_9MYCE|nr:hypothetical protein CYY_003845 [Polysphondylium violaceum]
MPPKFGSSEKCGSCAKSVYAAEKSPIMLGEKSFHKACMLCCECRKGLDSTNICENESKLYCKACYGKNFGPRIFGYSGGGVLGNTSANV